MDRVFQILAVVLAGAAAYFLWTGNKDYTFISVVLGCLSFFLSIRFQVKERNRIREAERQAAEGVDDPRVFVRGGHRSRPSGGKSGGRGQGRGQEESGGAAQSGRHGLFPHVLIGPARARAG